MRHKLSNCKITDCDGNSFEFDAESYSIEINTVTIEEMSEATWKEFFLAIKMKITGKIFSINPKKRG